MPFNPNIKKIQQDLGLVDDGLRGPITDGAILKAASDGRLAVVKSPQGKAFDAPDYNGLVRVFGEAGGRDCTSGRVILPFEFRLAWDFDQKIKVIACHKLIAENLSKIWNDTAQHYGEKRFRELGLDLYGGCFNYRPMRGSSKLSTHAWGIAVDVDPERNQLSWDHNRATLAREEYIPFWNIVEANGAYSLGRTKNYDWMHFQFCKP